MKNPNHLNIAEQIIVFMILLAITVVAYPCFLLSKIVEKLFVRLPGFKIEREQDERQIYYGSHRGR